jgi:hypothetical protein
VSDEADRDGGTGADESSVPDDVDTDGPIRESRADRLRRRRGAQRERVEGRSGAGGDGAGDENGSGSEETEARGATADDANTTDDSSVPDAATVEGTTADGAVGVGSGSAGVAGHSEDRSDRGDGSRGGGAPTGGSASGGTGGRLGTSVKEEQVGTYMYLPESQKKEVEHRYTVLKAEFEYEFGRDFEKNRHFFPLLVEHGLSGLDDADADDVREMLESLDR